MVQQSFYAPQGLSASLPVRRFLLRSPLFFLASGLLSCFLMVATGVRADVKFAPVHLRIAGKEFVSKTAPLSDGKETYIPLDVLKTVGVESKTTRNGDALILSASRTGKHREVALARPNGKLMLPLSIVAEMVDGVVMRAEAPKSGKSKPAPSGDTVYLLARVTEARFAEGTLRIATSFPVPFHARTVTDVAPLKGYVDCVGAYVSEQFKPTPPPIVERRILRLRAAQNSMEVARIVVELADGNVLKASDSPANSTRLIVAGLDKANVKAPIARKAPPVKPIPDAPVRVAQSKVQSPGKIGDAGKSTALKSDPHKQVGSGASSKVAAKTTPINAIPPTTVSDPDVTIQLTEKPDPAVAVENHLAVRGKAPSRSGMIKRVALPVEVRNLAFTSVNDKLCRVELATSGKPGVSIRYLPGTTKMIMDLTNTRLNLPENDSGERDVTHPLVHKITVMSSGEAQPMTRVTLDMARIAGFSINTSDDHCTLELRLPRNAYGALADKTIVVDAGHGGNATGATGHSGVYTIYEKDVTLAIALRLRAALEACGARVVMTRDHDADIGLDARPGLANDIGADLFISIHNDSNGVSNSASGTSTYYHLNDWSSRALATCVQNAVMGVTGLPSRGVLSDGVMYASGFAVLRGSRMPAVLCEVAYINNSNDLHSLLDPDFQQRVALAMCYGIRAYVEGAPSTVRNTPMTGEMPKQDDLRNDDGEDVKPAPEREKPSWK